MCKFVLIYFEKSRHYYCRNQRLITEVNILLACSGLLSHLYFVRVRTHNFAKTFAEAVKSDAGLEVWLNAAVVRLDAGLRTTQMVFIPGGLMLNSCLITKLFGKERYILLDREIPYD